MPLVVKAIQHDTLGLEMDASLLDVNSAQVIIPKTTEPRFGQKSLETFNYPLPLKLWSVNNGLPNIFTEHHEPERLRQSEMLNYSE